MLDTSSIQLISPREAGISLEVDEVGTSFAQNASLKAIAFRDASGLPSAADDSGLQVDALGGEPGLYSARFGGSLASDGDRVRLLLDRLKGVPAERRAARFVCVIALAPPGDEPVLFEGVVNGTIAREPHGHAGFGYDPVFFYPPLRRTFAELSEREKARVSHRGKAVAQLKIHLGARCAADILEDSRGENLPP